MDNVFVHQELVNRHASMVMWWNEDQAVEGDLNGSGTVDVGDVLAFIDLWAECPI